MFLLRLFLCQCINLLLVESAWPAMGSSHFQLLGLFPDDPNITTPTFLSVHARAMFQAAVVLSQRYNITANGRMIGWRSEQTGGSYINGLDSVCDGVIMNNTVGIVGPAFSREASIIATFARTIGLPVISYSATNPDLVDRATYPAFYRTVPSDDIAAVAILKLFQRYNWTSCVIIYQNDAFGIGGARIIQDNFDDYGFSVEKSVAFNVASGTVAGNLRELLNNSPTRIVIVWADVTSTPKILQHGLDADVIGPYFTWILASNPSLDAFKQADHTKLIGILTIEPVIASVVAAPINTTMLHAAYQIWQEYEPETFPNNSKIDSYGLFAFDATWSLILALQSLCSTPLNDGSCVASHNSGSCFDYRFNNSGALLEAIARTSFLGVSGYVQFAKNVTNRVAGAYYYAQNVQLSSNALNYVAVLKYSIEQGWNVYSNDRNIVWPGNVLAPATDKALLKGVNLRIAVIQSMQYTMVTYELDSSGQNRTKFTGYIPDLLELLRNRIGFNPTIVLVPATQTYSQTIDALANGAYDMIMADLTVTAIRREKVSFSNPIFDNSLRIIMRDTASVSINWVSYLKPFSRTLWLVLLGACIYAGLLILLVERQDNEVLRDRSWVGATGMSLWFAIGVILGYGADYQARTASGRLLTIGLYILSLVLVATYTANLASDLTIAKSKGTISGIDDIKNGKIPYNRIGVRPGTAMEEYYLREISGGNRNYYPLPTRQDQYDCLLNGTIDATFMDTGLAEYLTNNIYCNLTLVGTDFDRTTFGIAMPKQWLYAKEIDVNILSLRESGILDGLRRKWFQSRVCSEAEVTSTAMQIESLAGLFLTFMVISVLAIGLSLWMSRSRIKKFLSNIGIVRQVREPYST